MRHRIKKGLAFGLAVILALGPGQSTLPLYAAEENVPGVPAAGEEEWAVWDGTTAGERPADKNVKETFDEKVFEGDGTEEHPYEISDGSQLAYLSLISNIDLGSGNDRYWETFENKYFILTRNIDLSKSESSFGGMATEITNNTRLPEDFEPNVEDRSEWIRYRTLRIQYNFKGHIDGKHKKINYTLCQGQIF